MGALSIGGNAVPSLELKDIELAIAKLPKEQRIVVLLVGLECMAYDEVASILNVPVGTVRSRLSRGRGLLRYLMGMKEEVPQGAQQALSRVDRSRAEYRRAA